MSNVNYIYDIYYHLIMKCLRKYIWKWVKAYFIKTYIYSLYYKPTPLLTKFIYELETTPRILYKNILNTLYINICLCLYLIYMFFMRHGASLSVDYGCLRPIMLLWNFFTCRLKYMYIIDESSYLYKIRLGLLEELRLILTNYF